MDIKKSIKIFLNGIREESKDSKELAQILSKGARGLEITKDEEIFIHEKSKDILKSLGLLTVFVMPFDSLLLPFIIGWSKKMNIDIIPENFKEQN